MKKFLFLFILIILPLQFLFAAEDVYRFSSADEQQRFTTLTTQLRCLVCQNQNLAESNASLAADLRDQIYMQMQRGQSDKQIIHYLVTRYGDFILYRPPLNKSTFGLWFGPLILLIIGIGYLVFYISKKQRT